MWRNDVGSMIFTVKLREIQAVLYPFGKDRRKVKTIRRH